MSSGVIPTMDPTVNSAVKCVVGCIDNTCGCEYDPIADDVCDHVALDGKSVKGYAYLHDHPKPGCGLTVIPGYTLLNHGVRSYTASVEGDGDQPDTVMHLFAVDSLEKLNDELAKYGVHCYFAGECVNIKSAKR